MAGQFERGPYKNKDKLENDCSRQIRMEEDCGASQDSHGTVEPQLMNHAVNPMFSKLLN